MRSRACASGRTVSPVGLTTRSSALYGPLAGAERAEHHVRVVREVLVDRDLGAVELGQPGTAPTPVRAGASGSRRRRISRSVTTSVPGGLLVRAAGQADRADQVGQRGDLPAGRGVAGVHGVPGGDHREQAAGPGEVQGLDDEVVVDAVPALVVPRSCSAALPNGTLPMARSKRPSGSAGVGEGLAADLRVRVERRPRSAAVTGSSSTPVTWRAVGGEADEVPEPQPGSSTRPAGEAELPDAVPDGLHQLGVGVVRVDRGPLRRRDSAVGQQAGAARARAQANSSRSSSKISGTAPHPDQRARTACSSGVAGRSSRWMARSAASAARLARIRATLPEGARSSWLRGRNRAQLAALLPLRSARRSPPATAGWLRFTTAAGRCSPAAGCCPPAPRSSPVRVPAGPARQHDLLGLAARRGQPLLGQVLLAGWSSPARSSVSSSIWVATSWPKVEK